MYDIIFLGDDDAKWDKFKKEYPASHRVRKITTWTDLKKIAFTNHFWIIWDNIEFISGYNLNDYRVSKWEEQYTHIFRNGKYYDGVALVSKKHFPSNREFNHRFFVHKKEIDVTLSNPKPFDIIFISYQEPTADENYQTLLARFPRAKRVHGVKGIHQAHIEAAKLSTTDMFWVVDADAVVEPTFNFEVDQFPEHDTYTKSIVRVWRSRNPINGLRYGYGGIKLLPKNLTINMDLSKPDMTTSISPSFTAMQEVSNITCINTDPFTAWKSAFRECVKLSSKTITGQVDRETEYRLSVWCSTGADKQYGEYAIKGAIAGKEFGTINKDNVDQLQLINNFDWLLTQFQSSLP